MQGEAVVEAARWRSCWCAMARMVRRRARPSHRGDPPDLRAQRVPGARAGRVARVAEERRFELPGRAGESGPRSIGLGLAALGRPGYLNLGHGEDVGPDHSVAALRRLTHEVLDAAYEAGVRYFDAARSYGRAEEFLGQWLRDRDPPGRRRWARSGATSTRPAGRSTPTRPRSSTTTCTPCAASCTRRASASATASRSTRSTRPRSRAACSTTTPCSPSSPGCAAAASRSALSVSGEEQPETIGRAVRAGRVRRRPGDVEPARALGRDALALAHERGMAVIVKEALANGRLTARGADERLAAAAREAGATADALALAAVLARPWADIVLSGASTIEHAAQQPRGDRGDVVRRARGAPGRPQRGELGLLVGARRHVLDLGGRSRLGLRRGAARRSRRSRRRSAATRRAGGRGPCPRSAPAARPGSARAVARAARRRDQRSAVPWMTTVGAVIRRQHRRCGRRRR